MNAAADLDHPQTPAPAVWVELPDGQSVTAEFLARIRQPSGWWCELRLTVWGELHLPSGDLVPEPCEVVFRVPAGMVTPIDGTDYSTVPTRRPGPPSRDRLAGEFTGRWSLQRIPTPAGQPLRRILHYETCWLGDSEPTMTLDDARRALVEGAEPCPACGAERLNELRHPPPVGQ
ncbi:DUF6233 domain-containing protein [Streptomyces sp. NPDC049577]|uniref:DUF6233 domain-containing protein n=1 Tax=Streptomyces sp. NPDC049577 TaxID=3155153 RepID=UPI00343C9FAC